MTPIFWFFVAYLIVRFAVEDTKRLMQMKHITANLRRVSYGANVFLVAVAATFSLVLAIGPEENMVIHSTPFVGLMIAMPLVFVMHCFQDQNRKMIFVVGCTVFMTVSIIKVIFASIALIQFENFGPVSPHFAETTSSSTDLSTMVLSCGPFDTVTSRSERQDHFGSDFVVIWAAMSFALLRLRSSEVGCGCSHDQNSPRIAKIPTSSLGSNIASLGLTIFVGFHPRSVH